MSKKPSSGRRRKLPVILLILLLLAAVCVFGRPAAVSVRYSREDLKLRYVLFHPSFRTVGFGAVLYDENGATAPAGMTYNPILTSMNLGFGASYIKLAEPLPAGQYTLKITLQYRYFGRDITEIVSSALTVE